MDFYKILFIENDPTPAAILQPDGFQVISSSQVSNPAKLVDKEEVRGALYDVGPYKALGSYGFQTILFFNISGIWLVISVVNFIVEAWSGNRNWAEINKTLLVLIPKVKQPE